MSVHLMDLTPGQRIILKNQAVVQVIENMGDGIWVQVRYEESPADASMVGNEELCHCEEVVRLLDPEERA